MKRKILMIAHHFPPVNSSGTARSVCFAKYLSDFGYYPSVITAPFVHPRSLTRGVDAEPLADLQGRCPVVCARFGVGTLIRKGLELIGVLPGPRATGRKLQLAHATARDPSEQKRDSRGGDLADNTVRERLGAYLKNAWRRIGWVRPEVMAGVKLCLCTHFDLIWATGPPWGGLAVGYSLSRVTGIPLVADVMDPWTYGVQWLPGSLKEAREIRSQERRVLSRASAVTYTSPLTTAIMRRRVGAGTARKMRTITMAFTEARAADIRRDLPGDKCLFSYIGVLFRYSRNPDNLMRGFQLACECPGFAADACLWFVGGGKYSYADLEQYGLGERVGHLGWVSRAESRRLMRGSDVLIALQSIVGLGSDVISGKLYEYVAARKPILGVVDEHGGDAWFIGQTRSGIVTGAVDSRRIADGFLRCWKLWKQDKLSQIGPKGDISRFSARETTRQLAAVFDQVLDEVAHDDR